jgi:hypothetical protein
MTWDISPDRDQDYFEFVIGEFVPGVQRLGLQPIEAWATIYGHYPQIQVGLLADNAQRAEKVLNSPEWVQLQEQLFSYVNNFSYKVVPAKGRLSILIPHGTKSIIDCAASLAAVLPVRVSGSSGRFTCAATHPVRGRRFFSDALDLDPFH